MRVLLLLFSFVLAFLSVAFKDNITTQFAVLTSLLNQNNITYQGFPLRILNRYFESANMTVARKIERSFLAIEQAEGAGARVRRTIGTNNLKHFSPFLMLDHFNIPPGAGFPDHPHRGQETITYLLEGAVDHEDFTGSAGTIHAGDLQFMTAGKGIVHAEMPNQNQRANIGMQLWVDLPEEDKMCEPQYRDLKGSQIPHVDVDGGKVKVIIIKGHSHGTDSLPDFRPTKTEISMLDIEIKPGGKITQKVDDNWNAFAYVLGGDIRFGEGEDKTVIGQYNFVKFKQEGDVVVAEVDENATESGRFSKFPFLLMLKYSQRGSREALIPKVRTYGSLLGSSFGGGARLINHNVKHPSKKKHIQREKGKRKCPWAVCCVRRESNPGPMHREILGLKPLKLASIDFTTKPQTLFLFYWSMRDYPSTYSRLWGVCFREISPALVLLVAGKPLDQTVVQYGPFVLTTQEDALQAVSDYRASKNGFERLRNLRRFAQILSPGDARFFAEMLELLANVNAAVSKRLQIKVGQSKFKDKHMSIYDLSKSSEDGCTLCTLVFNEISPFISNFKTEEFAIYHEKDGWDMSAGKAQDLRFRFPGGKVYLPITSFSVTDSIDYSGPESLQCVARLVSECNNQHDCLQDQATRLPTRVIDVGKGNDRILRLYCPTEDETARYTILSHSWGGISPFITLRNNIEARKEGFDIGELPNTFRDAVTFTRELGIRYLWLDSICIIQKDRNDWESEGQRMADYYSNAYLTIAASRAANSSAGFLHWTDTGRPRTIHCESYEVKFDILVYHHKYTGPECELGNPLYTRGWVFQEMILSPRVISYGAKELEWYCRRRNWCECFDVIIPEKYREPTNPLLSHWTPEPHSPHWQKSRKEFSTLDFWPWGKVVEEFTKRDLTYDSDKLPAVSALASRFNEILKVPYLAGIWMKEPFDKFMWKALLWGADGPPGEFMTKPGPPSWSWASVNRNINYSLFFQASTLSNDCVTLIEANTQLRGTNPYGEVNGGYLRVRGVLITAQLDFIPRSRQKKAYEAPIGSWTILSRGGDVLKSLKKVLKKNDLYFNLIEFHEDTPLELSPAIDSSCLPTKRTYQRSSRSGLEAVEAMSGIVHCLRFLPTDPEESYLLSWLLVLTCIDKDTQTYERLGLAEVRMVVENKDYFREMEPQDLTIV
ncbi:hypothetical protein HYFRA_00011712 [Hymenoscyphus fraxineus]|uniref:Heterokaryon incompatibility domain-containing protein n=1 Tax=Hymenoscyphus fraxineus TaxID=746836 RepID=A0A9N9L0B0_9HELO|nr:hypothetical protein HYFRA_00011712 [Hymenoscyphus fraxineus]